MKKLFNDNARNITPFFISLCVHGCTLVHVIQGGHYFGHPFKWQNDTNLNNSTRGQPLCTVHLLKYVHLSVLFVVYTSTNISWCNCTLGTLLITVGLVALESTAGETSQTVRTFHTWARTVNARRLVHDDQRPVHDNWRRSVHDDWRPVHDDWRRPVHDDWRRPVHDTRRGFILGRFIHEGGTSIAGYNRHLFVLNLIYWIFKGYLQSVILRRCWTSTWRPRTTPSWASNLVEMSPIALLQSRGIQFPKGSGPVARTMPPTPSWCACAQQV